MIGADAAECKCSDQQSEHQSRMQGFAHTRQYSGPRRKQASDCAGSKANDRNNVIQCNQYRIIHGRGPLLKINSLLLKNLLCCVQRPWRCTIQLTTPSFVRRNMNEIQTQSSPAHNE